MEGLLSSRWFCNIAEYLKNNKSNKYQTHRLVHFAHVKQETQMLPPAATPFIMAAVKLLPPTGREDTWIFRTGVVTSVTFKNEFKYAMVYVTILKSLYNFSHLKEISKKMKALL